jgi:hypothetical protein
MGAKMNTIRFTVDEMGPHGGMYPELRFPEGTEIEVRTNGTHIQYRVSGADWVDFAPLDSLICAGYAPRFDADPIELRMVDGMIQWKTPEMRWWQTFRGD